MSVSVVCACVCDAYNDDHSVSAQASALVVFRRCSIETGTWTRLVSVHNPALNQFNLFFGHVWSVTHYCNPVVKLLLIAYECSLMLLLAKRRACDLLCITPSSICEILTEFFFYCLVIQIQTRLPINSSLLPNGQNLICCCLLSFYSSTKLCRVSCLFLHFDTTQTFARVDVFYRWCVCVFISVFILVVADVAAGGCLQMSRTQPPQVVVEWFYYFIEHSLHMLLSLLCMWIIVLLNSTAVMHECTVILLECYVFNCSYCVDAECLKTLLIIF